MAKILINNTASPVPISDVGTTVPASGQLTINPAEYLIYASSDNIISLVSNLAVNATTSTLTVNDGSNNLSISDGIDLIKGIFPKKIKILGDTDDTKIGNDADRLRTSIYPNPNGDPIAVDGNLRTTAFGELSTLAIDPYIALEPASGIKSRDVEIFTSGTGSFAGIHDNLPAREFKVSTGTDIGGYGVLRSNKTLRYKAGIGSLGRFTGRFTSPVANSIQRIGFFNIGNELTFGYDGTQFGILKKTGGRPELRRLTINTSSNQNTTATITLNGVTYNPSISNGTAEENAYEIATGVSYAGWNVVNIENTVVFQSENTASLNGTYSATAAGQFTASFTQMSAGDVGTEEWTYQADWNQNTMLTGSHILDPTKGNVYQIQYQYLGYGQIIFSIEDQVTGAFLPVHKIQYTNQFTRPSLDIPSMKLGIIAASAGSTQNLDTYSGSLAGFNESTADFPLNANADGHDIKGISTTLETIFAIRKNTTANDFLNIDDVQVLNLTVAADASKPVFFEMRLNPTSFSNPVLWQKTLGESPIVTARETGFPVGGDIIYEVTVSKSSNLNVNLKDLDIILHNDDVLAIIAKTTAGSADVAASLVWGNK